jgi:Zn-finger nucleic acid-binding protein
MGIWAPGESFDVLVDKAMETRRTRASEGLGHGPARQGGAPGAGTRDWRVEYRSCPVCGGQMQRKNYARRSGVIVDWCGEHGTWLDADELGAIAAFIMDGGLDRARREGTTDAPMSAAEARAMAEAERIMAGAKMAQARRRSPLNEPVLHGRSPLIELFDALLRR